MTNKFTKFLVGAVVAVVLGATSTFAYSHTGLLKQGMTNSQVMELQKTLNAGGFLVSTTGAGSPGMESMYFGAKTKSAVMAFQSAKGLTPVDGIVGVNTGTALAAMTGGSVTYPAGCSSTTGYSTTTGQPCSSTANLPAGCTSTVGFSPTTGASCSGGSTPSTGGLSGGAGDLSYSSTSTGLESDVKEGGTEKVLASKLEADGSDVAVTSVKVTFENNSGNGSTRLNKYIDSVSVWLGDKKVGSADPEDFSKDGDVYSKSISLSGAVVKEDEKANLYVAVSALDTVDDDTASFDGVITEVRWMDATNATFSDSDSDGSDFGSGAVETFGFDEASVDDDIAIKSSSTDPDAATLLVDANATSDEHLIGVFKLDVDEDSSNITVSEFPILLTFAASGNTTDDADADDAENYVDEIRVSVDGEDFTATLEDSEVTNGAGTAVYVVDDEFTIDAGDVVDVKIYATFNEQDGNYGSGATVTASTDEDVTENTPDYSWSAEGEDELDVSGSYSGETHTLSIDDASVDAFKWVVNSTGSIVDFFFTVEAGDEDFDVLAADITESVAGTATITDTSGTPETTQKGILSRSTGDSVDAIGSTGFTVAAGDTTTFRVRYTLTTGTNGQWKEITITSAAGQSVPDDEEVSPTATINVN